MQTKVAQKDSRSMLKKLSQEFLVDRAASSPFKPREERLHLGCTTSEYINRNNGL
jgi:hypothetical protein